MQKIRIDFDNPGLPQHISAVENDSQSRFFQATLYENGKAYTAPAGASYSIMYRGFGPQNQGWYDTINDGAGKRAACAVSGNVVTCEIARQALQVPGHVSIVLCVTTGKGYMLKSWPIECDCKNDRYDSTAEIQSFFYITQVSNADWNRILQALEDLKNTIDPTLSVEGKAADAKATGDAIGQLREDLGDAKKYIAGFKIIDYSLNVLPKSETDLPVNPSTDYEILISNEKDAGIDILLRPRKKDISASRNLPFYIAPNETKKVSVSTKSDEYYIRVGEQGKNYEYHLAIKKSVNVDGIKTDVDGIKTDVDGIKTDVDGIKADVDGIKTDVDGIKADVDGIFNIDIVLGNIGSQIGSIITYYDSDKIARTKFMYKNGTAVAKDGYSIRGVYLFDEANKLVSVPLDNTGTGKIVKTYDVNGIGYNEVSKYIVTVKKDDETELPSDISDILSIIKKNAIKNEIESIKEAFKKTQSAINVIGLGVDYSGTTDCSQIIQRQIDSVDTFGKIHLFFPKGTYLFERTLNHKYGDIVLEFANSCIIIANANPVYTTYNIAGKDVPPYSLGTLAIYGGKWTRTKAIDLINDARPTGFQVTKMSGVIVKNAIFSEITQSNHLFDISGTKNVLIDNCVFNGMFLNDFQLPKDTNGNFELLQIDLASGIESKYCVENGYNESTKNVTIQNCRFEPSGKTYGYNYRPIGIHYAGATKDNIADWYDGIRICNNVFVDVRGRAIEISTMRNAVIKGNEFYQSIDLIDDIIKAGDIRWGNTSRWASFNAINDMLRYNCSNIEISNNTLSYSGESTNFKFINLFNTLDTTPKYINSKGNPISFMGICFQICNNIGNLPISVKYLTKSIVKRNVCTSLTIGNCEDVETDTN